VAEGKTGKEALRALKRQISDAIFACLQDDARRAASADGPGGQERSSPLSLDPAVQKRLNDAAEAWATPFLRS